jgi:large subunit ribosomal protein L25
VNVKYPDATTKMALLKTYQLDPIRGEILHADFMEVSMTEKVRVNVTVTLTGEAVGIKRDKGILQHERNDVEVECLPDKIPGHLEVDISPLGIGQSVHVSDIIVPDGVKILTDSSDTLALISAPVVVEEVTEEVEGEEAEPEVVSKGKAEAEKEKEEEE